MKVVNLLEFLNKSEYIYSLKYSSWSNELINFFDIVSAEEQFASKINLGVMYLYEKTFNNFIIIDGINRIISLSLLLHAICECYKKTTPRNEKAIKTIRKKYLIIGNSTKLQLNNNDQKIYEKIIFGERLSGKEKEHPLFVLLHNLWLQIKEENLQASTMFKMLQKIELMVVDSNEVSIRDLYYTLNQNKGNLNQLLLIEDYLNSFNMMKYWDLLNEQFPNDNDKIIFLKDYFMTKFNIKNFNKKYLYEIFVNYFDTMLEFMKPQIILEKMINSAVIYKKMINIDIEIVPIREMFINIKMHDGDDTYAYLLSVYEDFYEGNLSEATFIEILKAIDEYLVKRQKNSSDVTFNQLIEYLNAFITCK